MLRNSHTREFVMGFFDTAFKFQPRLSTTCFSDGAQYMKGTEQTLVNMLRHASMTGADEFNFEDQSYTLLRKCNLVDTIQGTILINQLLGRLETLHPASFEAIVMYPLSYMLWAADWYSVMTAVMEISYSLEVFLDRMDWYNVGKISGKLTKLLVQVKAKGVFSGRV
jgi:hypothetical protein